MGTWERFWGLSRFERNIVIEAAVGLAASWLGLRLLGFQRWKAALSRIPPGKASTSLTGPELLDFARLVARREQSAVRHLPLRTNCLEQSLALWRLLRRRGIDATLRIGARKDAGAFEAHAWVECGGVAIGDSGDGHRHFAPFDNPATSMETQTP